MFTRNSSHSPAPGIFGFRPIWQRSSPTVPLIAGGSAKSKLRMQQLQAVSEARLLLAAGYTIGDVVDILTSQGIPSSQFLPYLIPPGRRLKRRISNPRAKRRKLH